MRHFTKFNQFLFFTLSITIIGLASCSEDDGPVVLTSDTFEGNFNINPGTFPEGGGLDLSASDTGVVAQLDTDAIDWDIQIKAIRTGAGGRPGVFLFGDDQTTGSVQAVNVSERAGIGTGATGFTSFERITTEMVDILAADGVFTFDPSTDLDGEGKPDATALAIAYQDLVIGDRIVNLEEADQPVYLVQDRAGSYYKFQMVLRENGGNVVVRWAQFTADALD
ncbi:MAG: hypothetical protein R8G66_17760 [Cytophagales bacterium]|nr:hypothetical protein [Cytophagales bacterium]